MNTLLKALFKISLLAIGLLVTCCTTNKLKTTEIGCNENPEFREAFFSAVQLIDEIHTGKYQLFPTNEQLKEMGEEELKEFYKESDKIYGLTEGFISQYTTVSWQKRLNYDGNYTTPSDYEQDRAAWLKWYEENKCNNIHIKKVWCEENEAFKKKFFISIRYIEEYVRGNVGEKRYKEAVQFIDQYTPVSWGKLLKYNPRIPYIVFLKDKDSWLRWYEINKCDDIQIKL